MKHFTLILLLVSFMAVELNSFADDIFLNYKPDAIAHIEYMVPQSSMEDLKTINLALTMENAVKLGIEHNIDIKIAGIDKLVQEADLKEAKLKRWPLFDVGTLSFLRTGDNLTLMTPTMMMNMVDSTFFNDFNATLRFPLFTGGEIRNSIKAASYALSGSKHSLTQKSVDIAYEIRTLYLKALYSKEEYLVHQNHATLQQELIRIAQERYNVGKGLKADILRIKAEWADVKQLLNQKDNELNDSLLELKAVMGIDLASQIYLSDILVFVPWSGLELENLLDYSLKNHPAILEASTDIEKAKAELKITKSNYFPKVYGQLTGNLRLPDRPEMMGNGIIGLITTSLPVFNRARGAEIKQAEAKLEKAIHILRERKLDIAKKITQEWNEMQFTRENILLSDLIQNEAQEDLRLVKSRWSVGRALQVEVQDAILSLRKAQLNNKQAIYNYEVSKASLIKALGEIAF